MSSFIPCTRQFLLAAVTAAALPFLGGGPAKAVVITIGGTSYDVMSSTLSYTANPSTFGPLPLPGQMPWWNNDVLASEFAEKVADALGEGPESGFGPVFAYDITPPGSPDQVLGLIADLATPSSQDEVAYATAQQINYAVATEAVPGPLPILGAPLALGWTRQVKRRLRQGKDSLQLKTP